MIGFERSNFSLSKSREYRNEVELGVSEIGKDGNVGSDGGEELKLCCWEGIFPHGATNIINLIYQFEWNGGIDCTC